MTARPAPAAEGHYRSTPTPWWGANGRGKSTLLQICAGTIRPSSGERVAHVEHVLQTGGTATFLTPDEHFQLFAGGRRDSRGPCGAVGTQLAASLGWRPRGKR